MKIIALCSTCKMPILSRIVYINQKPYHTTCSKRVVRESIAQELPLDKDNQLKLFDE